MIILLLKRIEDKLIYFFTFTMVKKSKLLEERDGWMIKTRIIEPLFFRVLYPLGGRLNNFLIFFEYVFSKIFHAVFPLFMNNVTNIFFKYTSVSITEIIINPIIVSFHFYIKLLKVREFIFILFRFMVYLLHRIAIAISFIRAIYRHRKKRKAAIPIQVYKRIERVKSRISSHKPPIFFYSIEKSFSNFINYIDDSTYERRLHVYIYATSPFRAVGDIMHEILTFIFIPLVLFRNIYFKIIYPPIKLRWLAFFFGAGYKRIVTFSREKYLFKFGYLFLFAMLFFTVANKLFVGGRYSFSKNSDTDILFGNWDPYSKWTKMFRKQLFFFLFAVVFIYAIIAREYLIQWKSAAEIFMMLSVIGVYLMERRYAKYIAEWEYAALSHYTFRSKKKKKLFYSLLCSTRSFFMGIDNFIKYITLRIVNGRRRSYTKLESKRRRHVAYKTLPRELKWVYGNEYVKRRHIEKLFWRFVVGKEPKQYPYMDFPHFGAQMEEDYFSNTKISQKNKKRLHRIVNHLSKRWKINYSKRSPFYLKEVNPSINIILPHFKSEQRYWYAYTLARGKVFEKMHNYPKRHNLKVLGTDAKWGEMFKLGNRRIIFKKDSLMMGERFHVKFEKRFKLPWLYVKDVRKRAEHFHAKISKQSSFSRTKDKTNIGGRLAGEWWATQDRKFHKLYKRTKYKRGVWFDEGERINKGKKGEDVSSFLKVFFEQNYTKLYGKILFTPSRKKTRLSIAGRGLYTWDMRYVVASTLYYWHILFYYHYFPIWLHNLPDFYRELLSYIITIS
uniref:Uncharacterized protein n=1 Tax=Phalansterium sp. PJK-2012 TaxID=1267188 RepID=T1QE01_9EUKA|nr:hypothetical protein [Phalansterium sp. PJK-2012]